MAEDMTGKLDLILAKATAHIGDVRYAATLDSGVPIARPILAVWRKNDPFITKLYAAETKV